MLVTVKDGVAVKVQGDPDHPFTDGSLCTKVAHYTERTYAPDRLLHPLKRVGPKGKGEFRRISWDEALDEIAARLKALAAEDPQQILPLSYAGTMGMLQYMLDGPALFPQAGRYPIGADAVLLGWQGRLQGDAGRQLRHGSRALPGFEADRDLGLQPDHLQPAFLVARAGSQEARRETGGDRSLPQPDGGEMLAAHRAAAGTDGALALAMMHVLVKGFDRRIT